MIVHRCQQGSDEWHALRCGMPTASDFGQIVTPVKGEPSKSADKYIDQLIAGRIIGLPSNSGAYTSRAMDVGAATEPEARQWYIEHETDIFGADKVEQVGFITTDDKSSGCSPDGLRYPNGTLEWGLEIKCPTLKTHIGWLRADLLPPDHKCQVHGGMVVTGLDAWEFLSYVPNVPALLIRVERDEFTEKLADAVAEFVDKLADAWAEIEPTLLVPEAVGVDDSGHPF